jgi:hypothetical protein
MVTTVRGFVREFAKMRRRADAGETIRIRAGEDAYLFMSAPRRGARGLLGCCAELAPHKRSKPGPVEKPGAWTMNG